MTHILVIESHCNTCDPNPLLGQPGQYLEFVQKISGLPSYKKMSSLLFMIR
jgi:hypothetical protein